MKQTEEVLRQMEEKIDCLIDLTVDLREVSEKVRQLVENMGEDGNAK